LLEPPDDPRAERAQAGDLKRSLSIALYTDGRLAFSWVFPFFVFKNREFPITGGYVPHRMYAKGNNLRDFGWMGLHTPSASRWIDVYVAAGAEHHEVGQPGETSMRTDFVLETGLKFRAQVGRSHAVAWLGASDLSPTDSPPPCPCHFQKPCPLRNLMI